ncbi:hypothetical protein [Pseudaestuariivita rosea]|nr:hypothetical protein [Pseudaestuariivita rosea]
MSMKAELSKHKEQLLDDFLGRIRGEAIPNIEVLDVFFVALASRN